MKHFILFSLIALFSCSHNKNDALIIENLYAWCIVPFDSQHRSPIERIEMLNRLGFKKYAYDWRQENISEMVKEWKLAKENNIEIFAVWMWIDDNWDTIAALSNSNEQLLQKIEGWLQLTKVIIISLFVAHSGDYYYIIVSCSFW